MNEKVSGKALAAAVALIAMVVCPALPSAGAEAGAPVLIQSGGTLCLVSADDMPRGGGPMLVCQLPDGSPFAQSPFSNTKPNPKLNLAVMRGGGQFHWEVGSIAGGQPINLAPGQTYRANGWTIRAEKIPTFYTYDASGHGLAIDPNRVRQL